jgi:hypothetical protein
MLLAKVSIRGIVVIDLVSLAQWVPDALMSEAIARAPNPERFAVSMCRLYGDRGRWER